MIKLKSMAGSVTSSLGSPDGLQKISQKYGKMASSVSISDLKTQAVKFAASKGISDKQVNSTFEKIVRAVGAWSVLYPLVVTPLGWFILFIGLIKSGSVKQFNKNTEQILNQLRANITSREGNFNTTVELASIAFTLFLACLIPPFIQSVILAPIMGILAFLAYVMFIIQVLKMMKREE
jgi:hypothetical protein